MVSSNILQRTFRIRYGDNEGTCFTIDQEGKQYIVSAAHVLQRISDTDTILVFQEKKWKELKVDVIGIASPPADIIVLAAPIQLSPTHPLPADASIYLSQDVYFLGFPYGLQVEIGPDLNRDFPLPLIKKGIVSSMEFRNGCLDCMLLDGHNNPGFSGGPVVCIHLGTRNLKVAGVISGYRYEWSSVYS
jgi:S1-C subfamily serine protease